MLGLQWRARGKPSRKAEEKKTRAAYTKAKREYHRTGGKLIRAKSRKGKARARGAYIEARGQYHELGNVLAVITGRRPRR